MEHFFELAVTIGGEEKTFSGRLVTFGYSYKFYIRVEGTELIFERDDERQYRVLSEQPDTVASAELLQAIINSLEKI
jgi:hypothetical protein